jgi:predicted ester cyclase
MGTISTTKHGKSVGEVARAYLEAVGHRDREAQMRFYAPAAQGRIHGVIGPAPREEVRDFFGELFDAFPDFKLEPLEVVSEGERAAVRWRATGTFSGPGGFMGLEPTGRRIDVEGIDMIWVSAGKVQRLEAYMDGMTLARQLGALPPKDSPPERLMFAAINGITKAREAVRAARER